MYNISAQRKLCEHVTYSRMVFTLSDCEKLTYLEEPRVDVCIPMNDLLPVGM